MSYLHWDFTLNSGDIVEVMSDTQANVLLLTDADYYSYQAGRGYQYYGRFFQYFPARIAAPHSGHWHVVLDLGGGSATVRHSLRVIPARGAFNIPAPASY